MTAILRRPLSLVMLLCASIAIAACLSATFAADAPEKQADDEESDQLGRTPVFDGLKTLALGMHNHHHDYNGFPTAATYDANQKKLLSWRVHILPFIDQSKLYSQFRLNEPWDSEHNKPLIQKMPKIFAAGNQTLLENGKTVFLVPVGKQTAFGSSDPVRIRDITDGTSNTIMFVTVEPAHAVEWTRPADWEVDDKQAVEKLTGEDGKGFYFGTCDGAAHYSDKPLPADKLEALLTRDGEEIVQF